MERYTERERRERNDKATLLERYTEREGERGTICRKRGKGEGKRERREN